jgi:hypothetical protein
MPENPLVSRFGVRDFFADFAGRYSAKQRYTTPKTWLTLVGN